MSYSAPTTWLGSPRRLYVALFTVLLMAGTAEPLFAAQATIVATASTTKVQVAEPFTLEWTVKAPAGAKVAFPAIAKQFGEFDVDQTTDLFDIPDTNATDARTWTRRLTLESIVTGELAIPALEVQVTDKSGRQILQANAITIHVASVLEERGDPTKFRDIQSVVDVELPATHSNTRFWWTASGVAGLSLLAIAALVATRRKRWVTPKAWAFEELGKLKTAVEMSSDESQTAVSKLSDIVRTYLLLEFGIAESGHTPDELLQAIDSNVSIGPEAGGRLRELFSLADQAKFAGLSISPTEMEIAISDARKLIDQIADNNEFKVVGTLRVP